MKYARVMHHIGGFSGANDNSSMIQGGEDVLTLMTVDDVPKGTDVKRLVDLGAIREATPDEVKRWEIQQGIREDDGDPAAAVEFTTGNQSLHVDENPERTGAAKRGGGAPDDNAGDGTGLLGGKGDADSKDETTTSGTYKGMGKGELSEYTVPELKDFAKEEGIEGYATMLKDDLLTALTSQKAE